jgi:MYXO-CTERM domain-containing protein
MNACCGSSSQWMQRGKASSIATVAHISMQTTSWNGLWALVLSALMLSSLVDRPSELTENGDFEVGRQGGVDADCSGLTFEDIFNYTHADFDIVFNDDWETAEVQGVAWVNGTLADDVRTDFDDLFEPLGSDNGYLSTDEYTAVRSVAADCVAQTNPRIGFRAGPAHRGGDGVNWFNASWMKTDANPLIIEEWNLMPSNHAEERPCQSSPNDCVEIPTVPNGARDCDVTRSDPDECRMIIWINATLKFDGLSGQPSDQFTAAMNTSNMTNTEIDITYPPLEGLRIGVFEECDGRRINQAHNDDQGTAPTPGTCTSDNTITTGSRLVSIDGHTRLKVETHIEYDMDEWPTGQDMFFDMTNSTPETDDPPTWTNGAPADGSILPVADDGAVLFLTTGQMEAWASDDHGTPLISCTGADGWSMDDGADGLTAAVPSGQDSTSITCFASDGGGQTSENRTFTLQVPLRISGVVTAGQAIISLTATDGMGAMEATITLTQTDSQTSELVTLDGSTEVGVDLSSLSPGPFLVHIQATTEGMAAFGHSYDLGISKASSPPVLTLLDSFWDGESYEMNGQFNDPDGDFVTITATNDDNDWGTFQTSGNGWVGTGAGIPDATSNPVILTACDSWGQCSSIEHEAGATPGGTATGPVDDDSSDSGGGGLPGFGLLAAIGAVALAGLRIRRREHVV